jgi:hypothetical protein
MSAFSSTAFSTSAFSVTAFDFGTPTPPPVVVSTVRPSGGYPNDSYHRRTREQVSRDRKRFGIIDALAAEAIAEVAARQAERLEADKQKQYDELKRELELRRIEWETGYLEALNAERERLISAEIALRIHKKIQQDEEDFIVMALLTAAAAS